jgi:hypothetical protein
VFGRFEAARPNELWTGDALHGPRIGGRKTYLFAFLDDHSRAVVGHRFGFAEDTVRLAAALRPALGSRGVPDGIYVDNGSAFVDAWLLCGRARNSASDWSTPPRAARRAAARSSASCAPRGALSHPRFSREELGGRFLGRMAYPAPKGLVGENSMPENQRPGPGVRDGALSDPRNMVKA